MCLAPPVKQAAAFGDLTSLIANSPLHAKPWVSSTIIVSHPRVWVNSSPLLPPLPSARSPCRIRRRQTPLYQKNTFLRAMRPRAAPVALLPTRARPPNLLPFPTSWGIDWTRSFTLRYVVLRGAHLGNVRGAEYGTNCKCVACRSVLLLSLPA